MTEQMELWTDGLGNTLWSFEGHYLITTVMTRTEVYRGNLERLLSAIRYELKPANPTCASCGAVL